MKILMLNYEFPPLGGGAANANYYLFKEFSKNKDLKIDLVTSSQNTFKIEKFSDNITIHKLDVGKKSLHYWTMPEILKWTFKTYQYSKKLVKKKEYDICHCWTGWPSGIIGYGFRKKLPYILALRGSDVPGYNIRLKNLDKFIFSPISKRIWSKAKKVTTNSEGLKKLALKVYERDIEVIYNGVDVNEFVPGKNLFRKNFHKKDKIRLISTGRLIERKGYHFLIEALAGLKNKFELVLIGEGDMLNELKENAEKFNVDVTFKGRIDHCKIVKELQNGDLFILPSLNEGMSNSVLEAMACGLPIIVTDVGGSKELVKGNGFIVQKENVGNLKKVLFKIDKKELVNMGKKSRQMVEERMSWKNMAERYLEVYDRFYKWKIN